MKSNLLSQEEIDQLLKASVGGDSEENAASQPVTNSNANAKRVLASADVETVKQCFDEVVGNAASTLSVLLSAEVNVAMTSCQEQNLLEFRQNRTGRILLAEIEMSGGITGSSKLIISERVAIIIAGLMVGLDMNSLPDEINDLYASAVGEAINQMLSSMATAISGKIKQRVDMMPPVIKMIDWENTSAEWGINDNDSYLCLTYNLNAPDILADEMWHLLPVSAVNSLCKNMKSATQPQPAPAKAASKPTVAPPGTGGAGGHNQQAMPGFAEQQQFAAATAQNVSVRPVQFGQLQPITIASGEGNMGLIMDVPMQITVELGRTRKLVREILDLAPGAVMELDKLAGEPVDILVNGKLIAKGEVVVIDENFAVKVTDIVGVLDRAIKSQ